MKTTKKDFELFKKYFNYYQELFGLNGYKVYFYHERVSKGYAGINTDNQNHTCRVGFSPSWSEREVSEKELKECALHEACHLLIGKLEWLATCRYVQDVEILEANNELTERLVKIVKRLEK